MEERTEYYGLKEKTKVELIEKLLKYLNFDNGFFVEAGAHDGVTYNNTMRLEKERSWKGILIEPSLSAYEKCCIARPNCINIRTALVSTDYKLPTIAGDFNGQEMSSIDGKRLNRPAEYVVPAQTLESVLNQNNVGKIDFFALDVEGFELEVLKGMNIGKYKPTYILIEIYTWLFDDINGFLVNNGYELVENMTDFNKENNPYWDGSHNDYLYRLVNLNKMPICTKYPSMKNSIVAFSQHKYGQATI